MTDGGRIVCVSTVGTIHNPPGGGCYFGSKGEIEQFCRIVAKEVAPRGITVNVVSPRPVETEMLRGLRTPKLHETLPEITPLHRLGSRGVRRRPNKSLPCTQRFNAANIHKSPDRRVSH